MQKGCVFVENMTIILRFRDLVTETGETIAEHDKIIKDKRSVWWAWWNKGNEQIPLQEFSVLRTLAENCGVPIYLLDSGQKKLYKTMCSGLHLSPTGLVASPEPELTPEYYRTRKYPAWFRFTKIENCDKEELRNFSYMQVDSLFCDANTNYNMFSDKRIYDIDELIQQNRTVWFVRDYRETDRDHEIKLLNAHITEPADFSTHYFETGGNALLWLSDLHFDRDSLLPVSKQSNPNKQTLKEHIQQSYVDTAGLSGLLISGDITNCGRAEGYTMADDFIDDLNRILKRPLTSESILFCPGNHDFEEISSELGTGTPSLLTEHEDSSKSYREFYHKVHSKYPNKYFACGRKFLMASGRTVEIAVLNSMMLQQYKDFEGHGYLSQDQLDYVANQMCWKEGEPTSAIRIAVMHHHYLPTCLVEQMNAQKASSVVYDAERLMQWLRKYHVQILLHGHKHRRFASVVGFPTENEQLSCNFKDCTQTYVIGMGGTGAKNCENTYGIIRFLANSVEIDFYQIFCNNIQGDHLIQSIHIDI